MLNWKKSFDHSLRKIIEETYQNAVALSSAPQALKESLRTKERAPAFLRNIELELMQVKNLNRDKIIYTVTEMTNFFLKTVQQKADEDFLTESAKKAILDNAEKDRIKDELADAIIDGSKDGGAAVLDEDKLDAYLKN